jgi:thioredoxin reductase
MTDIDDLRHGPTSVASDNGYDVAVIGGGPAGLSAATALGRFRQSIVMIDDGTPRNAAAGHVHNLLTRDGTSPAELHHLGHAEVERYGGHVVAGTVRSIHGRVGAFTLQLDDQTISAQRIIVATGGRDELPNVPGLAARWGVDVVHCPFCHGYEVRDQRIGVLATGPMAIHQAMLFRLLSPHITVLAHTAPPTPQQADDLAVRGITIVSGVVAEVLSRDNRLTGALLADGSRVDLDAIVVSSIVHARADFLAPLGLHPTDLTVNGHVLATYIQTGANGATGVPGIWIAGNTSEPMSQVVNAAASGLAAAQAVIGELLSKHVGTIRDRNVDGELARTMSI